MVDRAERHVLALNAGSSSIKFAVFAEPCDPVLRGQITGIGTHPSMRIHRRGEVTEIPIGGGRGEGDSQTAFDRDFRIALGLLMRTLESESLDLLAIGHRVVHGGGQYTAPVIVTDVVLADLQRFIPLAPLHEPYALALIRAMRERFPDTPQVASFDTAFHTSQPRLETLLALPRDLTERGVRRYGFHGLSYEYIARRLAISDDQRVRGRTIVAHLGQGASLCALRGLTSVATTMGFSALDGLPMGRRCGNLDPGVVLHLIRQFGMDPEDVQRLLYEESGMLGVSGISADMRELEANADPAAQEAIDLFIYRINQWIGALAATLGGLDALIFTAGIGENSSHVRAEVCRLAAWLGVAVDVQANRRGEPWIHAPESRVAVGIVHTDEEMMVALGARELAAA